MFQVEFSKPHAATFKCRKQGPMPLRMLEKNYQIIDHGKVPGFQAPRSQSTFRDCFASKSDGRTYAFCQPLPDKVDENAGRVLVIVRAVFELRLRIANDVRECINIEVV